MEIDQEMCRPTGKYIYSKQRQLRVAHFENRTACTRVTFKHDVMHFDSQKEGVSKGLNIIYGGHVRASYNAVSSSQSSS